MIRMVWWAAALFLAGGCTLGVAVGGAAEWLEMRGEWDKGYQQGTKLLRDLCLREVEAEDGPADLWGVDDEATAAWIEGLADPLPVLARARELLKEGT